MADPAFAEDLTRDVIAMGAKASSARLREIYTKFVTHMHAFVRDAELTPEEWLEGITFLTATGQMCDDVRQEFILLSDTLGISMLVDALASRVARGGTESTVLGPFFTTDAPDVAHGASIATKGTGIPLDVTGSVRDLAGNALEDVAIEVWEVDGDGLYDVQYDGRSTPDCRGRVHTDATGAFAFGATLPVSYSIPGDGPVGTMLAALGRHTMRPAHLHFSLSAPGFVPLTTAIYVDGDPYIDSDAVFGVKSSLIGPYVAHAGPRYSLHRDFVLVPAPATVPA